MDEKRLNDIKKIIGQRLRILRTSLGLKQSEFAERIDSSQRFISEWELGKRIVSTEALLKICEEFGLPFSCFDPNQPGPEEYFKSHHKK